MIFSNDELGEVSWAGYLNGGISLATQDLLHPRYDKAIEQLPAAGAPTRVQEWLAQHLILIHGYADEEFVRREQLERFFARASEELRYHALWSIANHVRSRPVAEPTLERFMSLWTSRVEAGGCAGELKVFDDWALTKSFAEPWILTQLALLGELRVTFLRYTLLVELLDSLRSAHTAQVASAARALTEAETDFIQLHASRHHLRRIVEASISAGDPATVAEARRLANILTARGLSDFKDLT